MKSKLGLHQNYLSLNKYCSDKKKSKKTTEIINIKIRYKLKKPMFITIEKNG
jgi:hypothetical protein